MKTLFAILFLILSSVSFGQIIEIQQNSQYDIQAIEAINKLRDSLGLKQLKRDAKLDSAAKHHAYYLAYALMQINNFYITDSTGKTRTNDSIKHREILDIPNFEEKVEVKDRTINRANEILFTCHYNIPKNTTNYKNIPSFMEKILNEEYNGNFQKMYISVYKSSKAHYSIITQKDKVDLIGSYTLLIVAKSKFYKEPRLFIINVTNTRPEKYTIEQGTF